MQVDPEPLPSLPKADLRYPLSCPGMAKAAEHAGYADHAVVQAQTSTGHRLRGVPDKPVDMSGQVFRASLGYGIEHASGTGGNAEPADRCRELLDVTGKKPVIARRSRAVMDRQHQGSPGFRPTAPVRRDRR